MNAGLRYLLVKTSVGFMRRMRRRFPGARGVMMLIGLVALIALLVVPQFFVWLHGPASGEAAEINTTIRSLGPTAVLLLVLVTSMIGGIHFRAAEIQLLFPAPIARRELLVYDALSKLRLQAVSGLWVSIFILGYAGLWYAAPVAAILVLAFRQFSAQAVGLLLVALEARFGRVVPTTLMVGVPALLIAGAAVAIGRTPPASGALAGLEQFASLPPVALLSSVARPLIEIYLAESLPAFALWTAVSIGVLALLLGLTLAFDVAYTEDAVERAQKIAARFARMRAGGSAFQGSAVRQGGLRIPRLPNLGGAGPLAWRQLQELARNYRSILGLGLWMLVFLLSFFLAPALLRGDGPQPSGGPPTVKLLVALLVLLPMATMHLAFGFRRDLDRMALLKSLPISGFALAAGQIAPTALLLTAFGLVGLAVLTFAGEPIGPALTFGIVLGVFPFSATLVAMDNALFLKLPYRVVAGDPGRLPFMGRLMVVALLEVVLLLVLAGLIAIPATIVWLASGNSVFATAAVVAALLLGCAVLMTFAVASAFDAFDVSCDVPD